MMTVDKQWWFSIAEIKIAKGFFKPIWFFWLIRKHGDCPKNEAENMSRVLNAWLWMALGVSSLLDQSPRWSYIQYYTIKNITYNIIIYSSIYSIHIFIVYVISCYISNHISTSLSELWLVYVAFPLRLVWRKRHVWQTHLEWDIVGVITFYLRSRWLYNMLNHVISC